jgi:hypothetical protein
LEIRNYLLKIILVKDGVKFSANFIKDERDLEEKNKEEED